MAKMYLAQSIYEFIGAQTEREITLEHHSYVAYFQIVNISVCIFHTLVKRV